MFHLSETVQNHESPTSPRNTPAVVFCSLTTISFTCRCYYAHQIEHSYWFSFCRSWSTASNVAPLTARTATTSQCFWYFLTCIFLLLFLFLLALLASGPFCFCSYWACLPSHRLLYLKVIGASANIFLTRRSTWNCRAAMMPPLKALKLSRVTCLLSGYYGWSSLVCKLMLLKMFNKLLSCFSDISEKLYCYSQ